MSQQPLADYLRHGQTPFFRLPLALDPPAGALVFVGAPWDGGVTYRGGARFAPWEVRRVSALLGGPHPTLGVDPFVDRAAVDGGNAPVAPLDAALTRRALEAHLQSLLERDTVPLACGGDHSITLPALRAAARHYGALAAVHFDAHADTSDGEGWGEPFHHGTPLRHALQEGLIAPGQLHQIGLRATRGGLGESRLAAAHGANVIPIERFDAGSARLLLGEVVRAIGDRPTWITIDVDVCDPAFAPGTGTPVPGGLTSRELLAALRALAGVRLVGGDVVEVSPSLDPTDATVLLGAQLLYELATLAALSPGSPHARHLAAAGAANA